MTGFKDFSDGSILTSGELDTYLMSQVVFRYATTTALLSELVSGVRVAGMRAYAADTATEYMYQGSGLWMPMDSQWANFTTVWSGPTTLSIGNGTLTCDWRYSGGLVFAHYELTRGSTTNTGSGSYSFTLPVTAATGVAALGSGLCRDASPFTETVFTVFPISSTAVALMSNNNNTRHGFNTPIVTPATGDIWSFNVEYKPNVSNGIS